MYYVVDSENNFLCVSDEIFFIKLNKNGCYNKSSKIDACGIVVDNVPYHLIGTAKMKGTEKDVTVTEISSGDVFDFMTEMAYKLASMSSRMSALEEKANEQNNV